MPSPSPHATTDLARHCWDQLFRAAASTDHPWRTPVVATAGADGPEARKVVLREAVAARRSLVLHTDRRSPKARQLARDDRLSWVFWDPAARVQLRCRGRVACANGDDTAQRAWNGLGDASRALYGAVAPGTPLPEMGEAPVATKDGFVNFLLVTCTIDQMDWLKLERERHLRARLAWIGDAWRVTPVAP